MANQDRPMPGKLYALTGGTGRPSIAGGSTWAESIVKDEAPIPTADEKAERRARFKLDMEKRNREIDAFEAEYKRLCPAGYKGCVVATLVEDDSDSMSDYYGHKELRRVVIGFAKTQRSLFGNMRKAAATFEPTRHLEQKNPRHEHRENYSMGGGMYLKDGGRHSNGWSVKIMGPDYVGVSEFSPALGEG